MLVIVLNWSDNLNQSRSHIFVNKTTEKRSYPDKTVRLMMENRFALTFKHNRGNRCVELGAGENVDVVNDFIEQLQYEEE